MAKRQRILDLIRIDAATHGEASKHGVRLYVENRIPYADFLAAVRKGVNQWEIQAQKIIWTGRP